MTLRGRIMLVVAAAVAAAVIGSAAVAYDSARRELRQEVDTFLLTRLGTFTRDLRGLARGQQDPRRAFDRIGLGLTPERGPLFAFDAVAQVTDADGRIIAAAPGQPTLPVTDADRAVTPAAGQRTLLRDVSADGARYRMLTAALPGGRRVQIARSLAETDKVLDGLRNRLGLIALVGTALAGVGAWLAARRATRPIEALTTACERVAETQDLATPVPSATDTELGRLATSFNTMLAALASSREQQRRLVADAGHELRTPLTAIRTNVDFLERASTLPDGDRRQVLAETRLELDAISDLVGELVQLASDAGGQGSVERIELAGLVDDVAARYRRRTGRAISVSAHRPGVVDGRRSLLDRAVSNLVDNALKFSPAASEVEIDVTGGQVEVADRGCGLAPEDHVRSFDRFYRAAGARTLPGSGLGLAIVAQIADSHGGRAELLDRDRGGTTARLTLPISS